MRLTVGGLFTLGLVLSGWQPSGEPRLAAMAGTEYRAVAVHLFSNCQTPDPEPRRAAISFVCPTGLGQPPDASALLADRRNRGFSVSSLARRRVVSLATGHDLFFGAVLTESMASLRDEQDK